MGNLEVDNGHWFLKDVNLLNHHWINGAENTKCNLDLSARVKNKLIV